MNNNNVIYRGPGFCSILTIVFIVLKLCGVITWSWWWVLAPIWIPTAVVLTFFIIVGIIILYSQYKNYQEG